MAALYEVTKILVFFAIAEVRWIQEYTCNEPGEQFIALIQGLCVQSRYAEIWDWHIILPGLGQLAVF